MWASNNLQFMEKLEKFRKNAQQLWQTEPRFKEPLLRLYFEKKLTTFWEKLDLLRPCGNKKCSLYG